MRKHKNKIIIGVVIAIILAFFYWWGGDAPFLRGWEPNSSQSTSKSPMTSEEKIDLAEKIAGQKRKNETEAPQENETPTPETKNPDEAINPTPTTPSDDITYSENNGMEINEDTGTDEFKTEPVPSGKPVPIEPQDIQITDKALTCTMSVRCDTILQNISWLDKDKKELVPNDGVILAEKEVTFYEGESVFNLLVREMKKNKIHLEFMNTPIYNSAYIEGIANLYEFDCGELSGWMYKVNGWFPNYGCSRYQLKAGDRVEWVYTCDLGTDVGGYYSAKQKDE